MQKMDIFSSAESRSIIEVLSEGQWSLPDNAATSSSSRRENDKISNLEIGCGNRYDCMPIAGDTSTANSVVERDAPSQGMLLGWKFISSASSTSLLCRVFATISSGWLHFLTIRFFYNRWLHINGEKYMWRTAALLAFHWVLWQITLGNGISRGRVGKETTKKDAYLFCFDLSGYRIHLRLHHRIIFQLIK